MDISIKHKNRCTLQLHSVGSTMIQDFKNKVYVYPTETNGICDCNCPTEIDKVSDEWWKQLSDYDFLLIADNINLRPYLKNVYFSDKLDSVKHFRGMSSLEVY